MSKTKTLEKIRATIYNQREGRLSEEEAWLKVVEIMQLHQARKLSKRE